MSAHSKPEEPMLPGINPPSPYQSLTAGSIHVVVTPEGEVGFLVGRIDPASRKMLFSQGCSFPIDPKTPHLLATALRQAARANFDDETNVPW